MIPSTNRPRLLLLAFITLVFAAGCKKTGVIVNDEQQVMPAPMDISAATAATDSILQVHGRFLLFPNGDTIILHGVNVPVYHSGYANDLSAVANAIKTNTYSNAVRLNWYSKKVLAKIGNPPFFTNANLDKALAMYASKKIFSILDLHDLTAIFDNSVNGFNNYATAFWTDPAILAILKKHQNHLILNLANEWSATWAGMTGATFTATYSSLIVKLRNAGITNPVMIDAPDGGTNSQFLINYGQGLINADPLHNVILSVHTYWSQENGIIVTCPTDYTRKVKAMFNSGLPFFLGEVSDWSVQGSNGQDHESVVPVTFTCNDLSSPNKYSCNYDAILKEAYRDKIGFTAWAWYQDGLKVRNIYNQDNGTAINTSPNAGSWPTDMMSTTLRYGLKNKKLNDVH